VRKAARLTLTVAVAGTEYGNEWPVFVFTGSAESESEPEPEAGQVVVVTADLESAQAELARGGRVLLLANKLGGEEAETRAAWQPLYWSLTFMPGQRRQTLGAIVRADHPALRGFPTQGFLDWQWRGLAQAARGFDLAALPAAYRPIVQPVSDFHESRKLGSLFELRVGEQGKLLVCGYDLGQPGKRSLEARQLLRSLLEYARSDEFHPVHEVQAAELAGIFAGSR
jgi:beta-galactosidase